MKTQKAYFVKDAYSVIRVVDGDRHDTDGNVVYLGGRERCYYLGGGHLSLSKEGAVRDLRKLIAYEIARLTDLIIETEMRRAQLKMHSRLDDAFFVGEIAEDGSEI